MVIRNIMSNKNLAEKVAAKLASKKSDGFNLKFLCENSELEHDLFQDRDYHYLSSVEHLEKPLAFKSTRQYFETFSQWLRFERSLHLDSLSLNKRKLTETRIKFHVTRNELRIERPETDPHLKSPRQQELGQDLTLLKVAEGNHLLINVPLGEGSAEILATVVFVSHRSIRAVFYDNLEHVSDCAELICKMRIFRKDDILGESHVKLAYQALARFELGKEFLQPGIVATVIGDKTFKPEPIHMVSFEPFLKLEDVQLEAFRWSLRHEFTLVAGLPACGKTQLAAAIAHGYAKHYKVLAITVDESGLDAFIERIVEAPDIVVAKLKWNPRIGRRKLKIISKGDTDQEKATNRGAPTDAEIGEIFGEVSESKLFGEDEDDKILKTCSVLCCTLASSTDLLLQLHDFRALVIDGADEMLEIDTLITICLRQHVARVALLGTPGSRALQHVLLRRKSREKGFGLSMFERLLNTGSCRPFLLTEQHRMHWNYAKFINKLELLEFPNFFATDESSRKPDTTFNIPALWPDLENKQISWLVLRKALKSRMYLERQIAWAIIHFYKARLKPKQLFLLTFYEEQSKYIETLLREQLKEIVSSSKQFQKWLEKLLKHNLNLVEQYAGKEADVAILLFYHGDEETQLEDGLSKLLNANRLLLALTRARKAVLAIGDGEHLLLNGPPVIGTLLKTCQREDCLLEKLSLPD